MEKQDKAQIVEVLGSINSDNFWLCLEDLYTILVPLHIAQKISEASNASIMDVVLRWLIVEAEMTKAASRTRLNEDIQANFTRIEQPLEFSIKEDIRRILEPQDIWFEFLQFRQKEGPFYKASCWQRSNIKDFWLEAGEIAPALASFAKRLINAIVNSAVAECAFSLMNLQHTKLRNRLEVEQPNKKAEEVLRDIFEDEDEERTRIITQQRYQFDGVMNNLNSMDDPESEGSQETTALIVSRGIKRPWE
uniref:HAT C-terminal dimerisation domain-containing protein n=1 Tax=Talaromyces marneffei PM1 TaxID=1077442 RepID=A0A093V329_TALMA